MTVDEKAFESLICDWLVDSGGYTAAKVGTAQGAPTDVDPVRGLDAVELFAFIGATQGGTWHELRPLYGDPDRAQRGFADRLARPAPSSTPAAPTAVGPVTDSGRGPGRDSGRLAAA
jgi:hypothetical protein